jgi:hypothetical protein
MEVYLGNSKRKKKSINIVMQALNTNNPKKKKKHIKID